MKNSFLTFFLALCALGIKAQTSVVIQPSQAASLGFHTGFPAAGQNYNNAAQLAAFCIPGAQGGVNSNRALIQFNYSTIPAGATIISAKVSFFKIPAIGFLAQHTIGNNQSILQRVTNSWNASTVTWNSQPSVTTTNQAILPASSSGNQNYEVDITEIAQFHFENPSENYGMLLRLEDETPNRVMMFASEVNTNASLRPFLTVQYCLPTQINITANGPTSFCEGGSVTLSAPASTPVIWNDGNTDNPRVVSQSGTYSIQNPGTACPVNSNSINVTVFDNPAQPSTSPSGNVSITEGTSLTINASAANAYEWIPGGQTQSSITVSQAGSYQVRIFDENGCSSLSNAVNVSVVAPPPPPTDGCFAIQVVEYNPKKRNDGSNIPAERTIATRATLEPQGSDAATSEANVNFVSLGFGGSIVLRMSGPIANGEGNDITVFETTFSPNTENCNRYPESVQAFASQDGCNWVYLGEDCQNASFDLGPLDWAEYIKLVDVSPADHPFNNSISDGYDVDGVVCLHGLRENPVPQDLGNLYASTVESFNQGTRKNGTPVLLARSNPNNTLGAPQNNNTVNFFSLGFGGSIVLKLGYVAFDKEGSDLHIVETSFGNPSCTNYPEKANIEVSLDGVEYTDLGEICVDGSVDFASGGINAVQYVRITDRSMASQFNGSADAYDVDAIVVLQPGCSSTNTDQTKIADNVLTPNETEQLNGISTIFDEQIQLSIETTEINEVIQIQIVGIDGKVLINESIQTGSSTLINQIYSLKGMSSGIYFVRGSSPSGSFTNKVFKP